MFLPLLAVKIDIHSDETFDITYFYARSDTFFYADALKYLDKYYILTSNSSNRGCN